MVQRLNGLRHDAIVSGNNQDGDVGYLSTTSTHRREGFVTGGVNEGDQAIGAFVVSVNLVGTNVLGNSTRFAGNNVCFTNGIQQTCLTVVNVTHHGDNWRTWNEISFCFSFEFALKVNIERIQKFFIFFFWRDDLNLETEFFTQNLEGCLVDRFGSCCHFTKVEQNCHQVRW